MQQTELKYVEFPIQFIPQLIFNKEQTIDKIIKYGVWKYSHSFQVDLRTAIIQFLYIYYRQTDDLTDYLFDTMQKYVQEGSITLDEDYNGFNGKKFNPERESEQLLKICEVNDEFQNKVMELYRMYLSSNFFNLKIDFEECLKVGKEIQNNIKPNEPITSVNTELLLEFRGANKSNKELTELMGFLAIKSILGKKVWVKTNKKLILCRMLGYGSIIDVPDELPCNLSELREKYSKKYHMDPLLEALEINWYILIYSNYMRGLAISMDNKMTLDELIEMAIKSKKINKRLELKLKKQNAEKKVLSKLGNKFKKGINNNDEDDRLPF